MVILPYIHGKLMMVMVGWWQATYHVVLTMSWHISASWMSWDPFLTISTWWSHATRLWEPPPSNMIILFFNTQVIFSSKKSGISHDFPPMIKDHQSIFQAPSSRMAPEDRSRMALLVRSAAEAFQSEDADPGAPRCATARCAMPQWCHNARVSRKYWSSIILPCETPKHMINMHIFVSKRNLVVNGRSMIQLQWRTALASWALRTTGPWSSLGLKRSMNPCGTCRRRPVLGSDLQICSASLEVLYGLMMSCMFFGVLK